MGRALLKAGKVDAAEEAFDATIRIADETFVRYGRDNVDPKAVNLLDQSIADATLNKTDARRLRVEKSEINKYCSGLPPNVAALRHGAQIIAHVKTALELAPGDVELHSHTVQLFAYMKRWADLALHCERFASDCVKFDGVFVDDLSSLNPYPSAPLAQTLKGDHFDLSALDAATNAPKLLSEEAVGEAVRRMPMSMLPLYLRALRLEERYAEAQRAASILLASAREGNLAGCPITLLEREQKKRIRTCTTKDTGDALFRKGQYEEAAAKYGACLLVDAEGEDIATADGSNAGGRLHAVLHCNRAACFMASKQYREAAKECTAALHIHTLYMKAMLRRARCHSRLQRHEEAVSEYQHWISLAEAAARNPQSAAAEYAAACYFDKPSDTTPDEIEKARVELNEAVKAKNSQAEAEANARARAQRQKWYDDNLRSGGVGGDSSGATSDAHRRKQQWYESAGNDGSRRWDSFNGSSPKKPGGNTGRSYSHHRSPPRAQYQQQQQRSQSYRQQQSEASAPIEGNPKGRTHYEVLGISRNATVAQIKKAYRKMALKHHPDKGGSDEDFLPVQQAYDTLSDESSRRKYDNELRYSRF
jgi:tetratricopeptide (TPR) repeat protein